MFALQPYCSPVWDMDAIEIELVGWLREAAAEVANARKAAAVECPYPPPDYVD